MKTEELYYEDPQITEFTAEVLSCDFDEKSKTWKAVLNRTAFFPEQGGQTADRGILGGRNVTDVKKKGDVIVHTLDGALEPGSTVTGSLSWERRFDFMQQHTGEHIMSGLVHQRFGYDNVGFHLSDNETQLDFNGPIPADALEEIEAEANRAVFRSIPVKAWFPPEEVVKNLEYRSKLELTHDIRIVDIPGIDVCACCAPHCENTSQIGLIKVVDCISYKGGVRIHIVCGMRALEDYRRKQKNGEAISVLLSAKQSEIADAVKKLKEKALKADAQIAALGNQLMEARLKELPSPAESRHALLFVDSADQNSMRRAVNDLMEKYEGCVGIFCGSDADGYRFILGSRTVDMGAFSAELRKAGFKCGGGKGFLQGSASCTGETIRAAVAGK